MLAFFSEQNRQPPQTCFIVRSGEVFFSQPPLCGFPANSRLKSQPLHHTFGSLCCPPPHHPHRNGLASLVSRLHSQEFQVVRKHCCWGAELVSPGHIRPKNGTHELYVCHFTVPAHLVALHPFCGSFFLGPIRR